MIEDGRQSPRALTVLKGLGRYFASHDFVHMTELSLASGRRADFVALGPKGDIVIVEVKSSVNDFRSDNKWHEYLEFCDRFYFATLNDVPKDIFPATQGLIVADDFGAELLRDAEIDKLTPATRKAITLRLARAAASRFAILQDPNLKELSVT